MNGVTCQKKRENDKDEGLSSGGGGRATHVFSDERPQTVVEAVEDEVQQVVRQPAEREDEGQDQQHPRHPAPAAQQPRVAIQHDVSTWNTRPQHAEHTGESQRRRPINERGPSKTFFGRLTDWISLSLSLSLSLRNRGRSSSVNRPHLRLIDRRPVQLPHRFVRSCFVFALFFCVRLLSGSDSLDLDFYTADADPTFQSLARRWPVRKVGTVLFF